MTWVGMVMSYDWHGHGIGPLCILFLVYECCKLEWGESKVGDMVSMVGES